MATLYLMRHGETLFNAQCKIQGWCDSPLTEAGIRQCEVAREIFKARGVTFDHAYCSTAERTADTLEIVTENSMPYERLKGLRERGFGAFEGKDELLNPPVLPYMDFFVPYGGEDENEPQERMVATLTEIMLRPGHDCVLAVSSAGACGAFAGAWNDISPVQFPMRRTPNCTIFRYTFEEGRFYLQEVIEPTFE